MSYPSSSWASPPYTGSSASGPSPMPAGARMPLQIATAAPSSTPVTAASYIPGPGPSIPPQSTATAQPTANPLFASLGSSSTGPLPPLSIPNRGSAPAANATVISGVQPAAIHSAPAQPPAATDPNAEPHSFDDCPACRAEYAAAVAASINADAERKRIQEERERQEIEDAIRLSQQEAQSRPTHDAGSVSQQEEDELMRRVIEESTRNAAEEEERRRRWGYNLQTTLGEGSSSASGSNQPIDEDEVLKRVLEESARVEEEAAKRREQARLWEANAMDKSRRAAELADQQRYLEVQEASMWRAPGGSSSSKSSDHKDRQQPLESAIANATADSDEGIKKGVEKEDLSLDLGLRASRRSQELPADMPQEDFARAIAEEVRQRQNQRHEGDAGQHPAQNQIDEYSFWRNAGDAEPTRPPKPAHAMFSEVEPEAEPSPALLANVTRLAKAAAEVGGDGSQSVSLPPLVLGTSSDHDFGSGTVRSGDDQRSIDFPQSAVDTVPPSEVDGEDAETRTIAEEAAVPPAPEPGTPPAPSTHISVSRPLPIPPGPPPAGSVPSVTLAMPPTSVDENTDSIDSTLAEHLRAAAALETQLDTSLKDSVPEPEQRSPPVQPPTPTASSQAQLQPLHSTETNLDPLSADLRLDLASSQSISGDEPEEPRPDADAPVDADAFSLSESYAESDLRPSIATTGPEPSLRSTDDGGADTSTLDETDVMETNPLSPTDAPPSYAAVDPDPDASSRAGSVLSHVSPALSFPTSPLEAGVNNDRPGSGLGSGLVPGERMSRADSGASSSAAGAAAGGSGTANARLPYVGGMVGANPLLSGMSFSHNAPVSTGTSMGSGPRRSSGNGAVSSGGIGSGGGLGTGVGGNAFVQSGSAVQPAGQGRWSGEPQIAVALRRTSAANSTQAAGFPATSSSSASSGGRPSFGSSHRASMHGSSPPAPAGSSTLNPLFSAFGAEAEDADRSASAAAANAPRLALPREHIGGWAGITIQTSPPPPGPVAAFQAGGVGGGPSHYGTGQAGYLPGSGSMQFSPESSPSAATSSPPGTSAQQDGTASKSKKHKLKSFFSRHDRASSKASNRMSFMGGGGGSSGGSNGGALGTIMPYGSGSQSLDFAPERTFDDSEPAVRAAPTMSTGRARSASRPGTATSWASNSNAMGSRSSLGSAFSNSASGQTYPTYGQDRTGLATSPGQETVEELQDSTSALS
ncbi:hypothetical protein OC846_002140 [Tilletia horrida]|uniref:Uncharacterized protein n=1 Tax=Tilletia horrida TaxID=155126 RepID=A0AAN6JZ92_9BASI|nr:hypothetical protein OC846_002140 [Tilletia horrida]KAK0570199.1 hypothetical protein OC861_000148 [Tilletia horrida]